MDPGELFGFIAFMSGVVAIVWLVARAYRQGVEIKHRKHDGPSIESRGGERSEDSKRLEERVRVLERIATDRGQDVAIQIEALRDQRIGQHRSEARELEEKL
jgi:hypothetical protein